MLLTYYNNFQNRKKNIDIFIETLSETKTDTYKVRNKNSYKI